MDKTEKTTPAQEYRGAATDIAEDNKVTDKRVAADIREINNNPRNHEADEHPAVPRHSL